MSESLQIHFIRSTQGRIQKFQKGGAGSQILERAGRNLTFQCGFQSFSYKSLTNIPAKGGATARPPSPKSAPATRLDEILNKSCQLMQRYRLKLTLKESMLQRCTVNIFYLYGSILVFILYTDACGSIFSGLKNALSNLKFEKKHKGDLSPRRPRRRR